MMLRDGSFPKYTSHRDARLTCCFCLMDMGTEYHQESGFPTGRYKVSCQYCGKIKYYDLFETMGDTVK